jgi:hypothetical protein
MAERLVIDAVRLIALARADAIDVLAKLPMEFVCPPEVRGELARISHHGS